MALISITKPSSWLTAQLGVSSASEMKILILVVEQLQYGGPTTTMWWRRLPHIHDNLSKRRRSVQVLRRIGRCNEAISMTPNFVNCGGEITVLLHVIKKEEILVKWWWTRRWNTRMFVDQHWGDIVYKARQKATRLYNRILIYVVELR
jgi:hypothetical protein